MHEMMGLILFASAILVLMSGFPVAFALSGTALLFAGVGTLTGDFDLAFLAALPERIYGIMNNESLIAVPLFVFMGVMLERSRISEELLDTMARLMGRLPGGLGISVCVVGALLAASTGIVGATVVTMGLISLPAMLKRGYSPSLATGVICASGTLGQIIPPSLVLIVLGDAIGSAHQQAQLMAGNYSPDSVSVGDLFVGAIVPGLALVLLYLFYVGVLAFLKPKLAPPVPVEEHLSLRDRGVAAKLLKVLVAPFLLILFVLGSILAGVATPTESASVGCLGAVLLAWARGQFSVSVLREVMRSTTEIATMVFTILIGASVFSLVFRGFGSDEVVRELLVNMKGGKEASLLLVMLLMFFLGFFLDFFEIVFVVVPIVGPVLLSMGFDPVWLGVLIAMNLQTSFLTPPFGFSLFYLRGVAPAEISTGQIYRGAVPFIGLQLLMLALMWTWPEMVTWLPRAILAD